MQLKNRTNIKHNYANIILKRLEAEQIVKCLTPNEVIGKVFCINPESRGRVNGILREAEISQKVSPLPDLNWLAYGRLLCNYCRQLKGVFLTLHELNLTGRKGSVANLKRKLPARIETSDIYKALDRLVELDVIRVVGVKPKIFSLTESGLEIIRFDPNILQGSGGSL